MGSFVDVMQRWHLSYSLLLRCAVIPRVVRVRTGALWVLFHVKQLVMCMCVCGSVRVCGDQRPALSILLARSPCNFFEAWSLLNLELSGLCLLSGQWAPGIILSLPPAGWVTEYTTPYIRRAWGLFLFCLFVCFLRDRSHYLALIGLEFAG